MHYAIVIHRMYLPMIPTVLLLLACTGTPADKPDPTSDGDDTGCTPQSWYADGDGDGYGAGEAVEACSAPAGHVASGGDCDDADASVHPGAAEVCNDVDEDCDGVVDPPELLPTLTCYRDQDGDGWGTTAATLEDCACPEGYAEVVGDCDDEDAAISPDATESWYDGIDQDCAGDDDFDADGDGFSSEDEAKEGLDCDDTDDAVHPDAGEVCGNGIDDDCDGLPGACGIVDWMWVEDADRTVRNEPEVWGLDLESATSDVDGDGRRDVVVARYPGPGECEAVGATMNLDVLTLAGTAPDVVEDRVVASIQAPIDCDADWSSTSVRGTSGSDLDGDGVEDFVMMVDHSTVGGASAPRVYRVLGPVDGEVDAAEDGFLALADDDFALALARPYVLSGGSDDARSVLLHRPGGELDREWVSAYVLENGEFDGSSSAESAPRITADAGVSTHYSPGEDLDGDGIDDLVTEVQVQLGDRQSITAAILLGPFLEDRTLADADQWIEAPEPTAVKVRRPRLCPDPAGGWRIAGLVKWESAEPRWELRSWTYEGPGTLGVDDADARLLTDDHAAELYDCTGDFDGDGQVEWIVEAGGVGVPDDDSSGHVDVLAPPESGAWEISDLWLGGVVEDNDTYFSPASHLVADTDLDGDGFDDLVIEYWAYDGGLGTWVSALGFFSGGPTGL